jgi:hypothetical protein
MKKGRLIRAGPLTSAWQEIVAPISRSASVISYMEDACGVVARAEQANVSSTYRAKNTLRWIGETRLAGDSASA